MTDLASWDCVRCTSVLGCMGKWTGFGLMEFGMTIFSMAYGCMSMVVLFACVRCTRMVYG